MKKNYSFLGLLVFIIGSALAISSCGGGGDEPGPNPPGPNPNPDPIEYKDNTWIYQTMKQEYYWEDEIPAESRLDFSLDPVDFFYSLLSRKDGKHTQDYSYYYSEMDDLTGTKAVGGMSTSYGYVPIYYFMGRNTVYARLLYIMPNSPASEAGLKRGDVIYKYNGAALTENNFMDLEDNTSTVTLSLGKYEEGRLTHVRDVNVSAARLVEDNPFYKESIIEDNGKKIAYLMYNHFSSGPSESLTDDAYNIQMREIFGRFKAANPDEFILDLRNNQGGLISCARVMLSLLAPQSALNNTLGYLEYNKNKEEERLIFDNRVTGGNNLNLNKLYIITDNATASSSELIINALRPYMGAGNVILVGEVTEGKNVGSFSYTNEDGTYTIHPIACKVYNKDRWSGYENGFDPDFLISEHDDMYDGTFLEWADYGDKEEVVLKNVLSIIKTGAMIPGTRTTSGSSTKKVVSPRKSTMIIDKIN